jgi:hypothetical protein
MSPLFLKRDEHDVSGKPRHTFPDHARALRNSMLPRENFMAATRSWMVVDVAMWLESFYKPELDAAHNRALRPALR